MNMPDKIILLKIFVSLYIIFLVSDISFGQRSNLNSQVLQSGVYFKTSDDKLQRMFDEAECLARINIKDFGRYDVMVEGAGYSAVFLETQPMGGAMYAKRNIEIAKNNQLVFMDCQREDGRLPGSVRFKEGKLTSRYLELQGGFLPLEAFDVYFWIGKDPEYLTQLYETLKKYDNYLWKTRDSDNNKCLETWCIHDTGEDHNERFGNSYSSWGFSFAPTLDNLKKLSEKDSLELCSDIYNRCSGKLKLDSPMPVESMDVMSFSYANRYILARISKILQNGQSKFWDEEARTVCEKIRDYLWIPEKHACYDRNRDNNVMDVLIHNNLRCMYFGSFSQQMADEFIRYHLLNPEEFWTTIPLPSIAVNDPVFRNAAGNNWSGKPQGLTFQRSIRALENYGHYAELTMIGNKLLNTIKDSLFFVQQFDPFSGKCDEPAKRNGYGPTVLASLEFISRFYGIHLSQDKIYWSCLDDKNDFEYIQKWGDCHYKLQTRNDKVYCFINDKEMFWFTKGARVVSDFKGRIIAVIGIEPEAKTVTVSVSGETHSLSLLPNAEYLYKNKFRKLRSVEFSFSPNN